MNVNLDLDLDLTPLPYVRLDEQHGVEHEVEQLEIGEGAVSLLISQVCMYACECMCICERAHARMHAHVNLLISKVAFA